MVRNISLFVLFTAIALLLGFFFNGNISIPNVPLPALGKFLNPSTGVWNNARKESATSSKNFKVSDEIEIIFDERAIPHIFTKNHLDALFAEGYLEASNRLFQMDFISRATMSKLAEVLGPSALPMDQERLRKGTAIAADIAVAQLTKQPESLKAVEAYVAGANAYILNLKPKDYPIEYKLLGFKPEPWSVHKVAEVTAFMTDVLTGTFDVRQSNAKGLMGEKLYNDIFTDYPSGDIPVIQNGNQPKELVERSIYDPKTEGLTIKSAYLHNKPHGIGSNNWAITGDKSATGKAILCSDPHLMLSLPAIWYEMHINTPDYNAYGVSVPGIPGIFIGFNENITWSETNVGSDVLDLYKITWKDGNRNEYLVDGKYKPVKRKIKEIKIKGGDAVFDTTHITDFGHIRFYSEDAKNDLAAHWVGTDSSFTFDISLFTRMMKASTIDECNIILKDYSAPALNFLMADKNGQIALRVTGKLPARAEGDGKTIEDGTKSNKLGKKYIPYEQMPYDENPAQNYLTSSNQRSISPDYGYYFSGRFELFRNQQIHEILRNTEKSTVKEMKSMQGNSVSAKARAMTPVFLKLANAEDRKFLEPLENWDYDFAKNELAPALFDTLYDLVFENTYEEVFKHKEYDLPKPNEQRFIELAKTNGNHQIFDMESTKDKKESFADVLNYSIAQLRRKDQVYNPKPWGKSRDVSIQHITKLPAFSAMHLDIDGQIDCINAQQAGWGPSWRMVVSLDDKIEAWGVYPGGQSGDPASKHYRNFLDKWARKEHYKLYFVKTKAELLDNTVTTWTIKPDVVKSKI
ncbi:MAG: penicillin acylase family protein [Saprospiraceae bacterium]|nr:penicillin acylase family protein [Saprospiraceae bacterium]